MNEDGEIERGRLDRRKFMLGAALVGTTGLAYAREPRVVQDYLGKNKLDNIIPKHFRSWSFVSASGLVTAPEDQMERLLYSQLITRVYSADGRPPVMMLVAQSSSQTGVLQVHRPEVCYAATGYALSPVQEHDIPVGTGRLRTNLLTASADGRTEHIIYWTRVGDQIPLNWAQQRWAVAEANLKGVIPDAVLARVSVIHPDRAVATQLIEDFTRDLLAAVPPATRKVLIGPA